MSKKLVRCYGSKMRENNISLDMTVYKKIIEDLFNCKDVKIVGGVNKCLIYKGKDNNNYMSLEYIKKIKNSNVDDNYMFFRIGREKDIEGAVKRNVQTFEGKEVIDKDEQDEYNLEICTYILIDLKNGIISELYGRFAPTVSSFSQIINILLQSLEKKYENVTFNYANIMTEEMINAYANNADRLGKMVYQFEKPNVDFLKKLNLTDAQIIALSELNVLEVEVTLKGKNKIPLSDNALKIKHVLEETKKLPQTIRDKVKVIGKASKSDTKTYTFTEEKVTYYIDVPSTKKEDGENKKMSIEEIGEEVYNRMYTLYSENKEELESYML
ncbi:MAG: hypothetical protein E7214_15060 [Clostridium sp.]|nr:hypothetical protein [Clostridium sp.]